MEKLKDNVCALCEMTETEIQMVVRNTIKKNYKNHAITDQYIMAEGNIPICLVAHMDTVFNVPPLDFYYDQKEQVLWSPDGLGTDDRAGVYAILEIISRGLRPHVIFTMGEEKGGIGASALLKSFPDCPFGELNFIIELDRKGEKDCVFYQCDNPDFARFIKKYGFELGYGTFTDISLIAPKWKIAAVNLSVGYINEHTYSEMLFLKYLRVTIDKVVKILKTENLQSFAYIPKKHTYDMWFNGMKCIACGKYLGKHQGIKVKDVMISSDDFKLCEKCYEEFYGEPAIPFPITDGEDEDLTVIQNDGMEDPIKWLV